MIKKKLFWCVLALTVCLLLASCEGELMIDPENSSEAQTESTGESASASDSVPGVSMEDVTEPSEDVSASASGTEDPESSEDESAASDSSDAVSTTETSQIGEDPVEPSRSEESSEEPSHDPVEESSKPSGETSSSEECRHASTEWTTTREADCETAGKKKETCSSCGKTLRTESIPAKGHSFGVWVVTRQPTVSTEGEQVATCSVCGKQKKESIPKKTSTAQLKAVDPSKYYGYVFLGKQTNGSTLQQAYRLMAENMEKAARSFDIPYLSDEQFKMVFGCYLADYPEHFWVEGRYSYSTLGTSSITVTPSYYSLPGGLDKAKQQMEAAIQSMLSKVDGSMDPFTIELILHDALVDSTEWKDDGSSIVHSAYGALVNHYCVCDGYSAAIRLLLGRCGIETLKVVGSMNGGSHAWAMVKLDGVYYHLDATADDPVGSEQVILHGAFNVTNETIKNSHKIFDNPYTIPECTSTKYAYSIRTGTMVQALTVDAVVEAMVNDYNNVSQNMEFELFFKETSVQDARSFISSHFNDLTAAARERIPALKGVHTIGFVIPRNGGELLLKFS